MRVALGGIAVAVCLGAGFPDARAQTVPSSIDPTDPRDRVQPPREDPELPALSVPAYRGTIPPGADGIRFVLSDVAIDGATVLDRDAVREPFAGLIGREISLVELYNAANALQAAYRQQGYLLTNVVVPAQRMSDGVARIRVVEGYVGSVVLQGEVGEVRKLVEQTMARLQRIRPVRAQDIERYLLLANDIPGISAAGVLRPGGGGAGATQLLVELRRDPFDGFVTVNNRGSQFTGPWSAAVGLSGNSFSRLGERTEGFYYITLDTQDSTAFGNGGGPEQTFIFLSYEARLGGEGTRVGVEASQGISRPGFSLANLQIKNRVDRYTVDVSHPLIRSRRRNLTLFGSLESVLEKVNLGGPALSSRDRLTVLGLGAEYHFRDGAVRNKGAETRTTLELRQGLPVLGATEQDDFDRSRPEGTAVFTALRGRVERRQELGASFEAFAAAEGQYAFDTLLSQAEFRVGGDEFGRAFDPSELAGEHGAGAAVELRYNGTTPLRAIPNYQLYGFYDWGIVFNNDEGFRDSESLASTGVGARARVKTDFYVDVEYARTLNRSLGSKAREEPSNLVFVRFTAQY